MISLNELRIGNWIHHNESYSYRNEHSKEHDFEWNDSDWYQLGECGIDEKDLSFIQLTEQWFIKFGFNENFSIVLNTLDKHLTFIKGKDSNKIYWYPQLFQQAEMSHEGNMVIGLERIESVHQLQNLYFCLTGKELKIK